MPEKGPKKIDSEELEARRITRILALQIVATNPGLPVSQLSERFAEAVLQYQQANGGDPLRLSVGPGKRHQNVEDLLRGLSGAEENMLRMKGFDSTSTFELTSYGSRTLTLAQSTAVNPNSLQL